MFQPTNESFVQTVVEETQTRYQENLDDDSISKASHSSQPSQSALFVCQSLHVLGHLLHALGVRLENLNVPDVSLGTRPSDLGTRTVTHHAH